MLNVSDARILSASRSHVEWLHGKAGLATRRLRRAGARPSRQAARRLRCLTAGTCCRMAAARDRVWREMEIRGIARFPGATGRIPNFVGAERAALHLQGSARLEGRSDDQDQPRRGAAPGHAGWRSARARWSTWPCRGSEASSASSSWIRPRLGKQRLQAASIRGAERLGRPVGIEMLPPIDLIVCGAVAVNARGRPCREGQGLLDLEYGLLAEAGRVGPRTPIVTTVHPVQILPEAIEMRPHDIAVDVVVTPRRPDVASSVVHPALRPVPRRAGPGEDRRGAGDRASLCAGERDTVDATVGLVHSLLPVTAHVAARARGQSSLARGSWAPSAMGSAVVVDSGGSCSRSTTW